MAFLAVLQPDARAAARVSTALSGVHDVVVRSSWTALRRTLSEENIEGCIVDADHPSRDRARTEITKLRHTHTSLAIVAYADVGNALEYYDLGGMGVDGVLLASGTDAGTMRETVSRAVVAARAARVGDALRARFGAVGAQTVRWAMEHAASEAGVEAMAAGLGRSARSLAVALREVGLPTPGRVLVWGRLLQAGAYLGRDGRTIEETAYLLGYSSANALSRAMKRHTGLTPGEVAVRGGLACVHGTLFSRSRPSGRPLKSLTALILLGVALGTSACATLGMGGPTTDRGEIEAILAASPLDQVHFGVLAVDIQTGRILYARNAHRKFVPASNQKILVTSTAMSLLGADFRYETEIQRFGSLEGSTLEGDLVVVGIGDPSFSDRYWPSGQAALSAMADSVRAAGVRRVEGSLVIDVSAWDSTTVGPTWEVEDLRYRYGSTGGAFAIDEGEVRIIVTAGASVGRPATITWSPHGSDDFVESKIMTAPADSSTRVRPDYLPESRRLVLTGRAALGATDTLEFALRDPVRQAGAALLGALTEAGVVVTDGLEIVWSKADRETRRCTPGLGDACADPSTLVAFRSPPLSDLVAGILKPSQNWMTEQLIRTLGHQRGEEGSWPAGIDVVEDFLLNEVAVDSLDIAPRDGSGLSAYNLVTPRALVRILLYMHSGPDAAPYRLALARPGEEDSTLEKRLLGLEGRLFAKTGTISNVNSLSGYLVRDDGSEVAFSILSNGSGLPASTVRAAIDEVVRVLAR